MQPYFIPYLGYFSLIKHTDEFILLDTVQFIRHGWIERNRILKQNGGWQYIQVPLIKAEGRDTIIKDVRINNNENWKNKIIAQLQHYKKKAPYYYPTIKLLNDIFTEDFIDIVTLNNVSMKKICQYLGIEREIKVFSQMNLHIEEVAAPDEWALNICKAIDGVDEYWNPPGGQSFFDKTKYDKENIVLKFQKMDLTEYNQNIELFESGLSIIDVLMFNSKDEINDMLDKYTLL
jgi:WbqC-like protein family.